jgi:hypothetical protein
MTAYVFLGLGYSAATLITRVGAAGRFTGTIRDAARAVHLTTHGVGGQPVTVLDYAGGVPPAVLGDALEAADVVVASAAPGEGGDPFLPRLGPVLARSRAALVYLSTIGVYGDHGGAWVDEAAVLKPRSFRSLARVAAENAWRNAGQSAGLPVALLRLAGIYGPGQNALRQVRSGMARRIDKPGQVFNRIHVGDIAAAVEAAGRLRFDGAVNVADDEPTAPEMPILEACRLLGVAPPPRIPWAEAERGMSPMGREFYAECKRAGNTRLRRELGVALAYPTFREGLAALWASGE